jgi:hypothetical protein
MRQFQGARSQRWPSSAPSPEASSPQAIEGHARATGHRSGRPRDAGGSGVSKRDPEAVRHVGVDSSKESDVLGGSRF